MTPAEEKFKAEMLVDFPLYGELCLRIRTKSGTIKPLILNRAQMYLHAAIEDQLLRTGRVRKNILKGRQQGISTYIEGRLYWKVTQKHGWRAFILTHEQDATENLFNMAQRYHEHVPVSMKPHTGVANAKELYFDKLDSGYRVGTAGTRAVGRSSTIQLFHGSEVAFWPNADSHDAGVLQALPDEPGTEGYKESTANGEGNTFHQDWLQAEAGVGSYENVFIPWYWQTEYVRSEEGIEYEADEAEYADAYGLSRQQMAWRRNKILEFRGDLAKFRQEYPATPQEAFQSPTAQSFIEPGSVVAARKSKNLDPVGPLVMGVDVARYGDDRSAYAFRQGRVVYNIKSWAKADLMETVGLIKRAIDENGPDKVFVDVIGVGAGVVDRLREMGYDEVVGANVAGMPLDRDHFVNKRAEMYSELRDWLKDVPCEIPDSQELQTDLTALNYKYDSKGRYQMEAKEDAKKRGVRSPDLGDAVALTFFEPVAMSVETAEDLQPQYSYNQKMGWMR